MKTIKFLSLALLLIVVASCSGVDKKMKKMVPKDAIVVASFNPKALIDHSGAEIADDGVIKNLPQNLVAEMSASDKRQFEEVCKGIAKIGIDTGNKIYAYVSMDNMQVPVVMYLPLKSDKDTRKALEDGALGGEKLTFTEEDGIPMFCEGNVGIALKDDIMMVGMTGPVAYGTSIKDAFKSYVKKQFEADFANIAECEGADECLDSDNDANLYLNMSKLSGLMAMFGGQMDPSVGSIIELLSGLKAVAMTSSIADNVMTSEAKLYMDDNSDLAKLLKAALKTGDASFLQYVPANMDMVTVYNIQGKNIAEFEQVKALLNAMNEDPTMREMNIGSLLASMNGPVFMASDYNEDGLSNVNEIVVGFKTSKAAEFVRLVGSIVRKENVPATLQNNIYSFTTDGYKIDAGVKGNDMAFVKMRMPNAEPGAQGGIDAQEASKLFAGAIIGTYMKVKMGDYTLCADGLAKDLKSSNGHFYVLGKDGKKLNFMECLDAFYTIYKKHQQKYMAQYEEMMRQYADDEDDMAYAEEELVEEPAF